MTVFLLQQEVCWQVKFHQHGQTSLRNHPIQRAGPTKSQDESTNESCYQGYFWIMTWNNNSLA